MLQRGWRVPLLCRVRRQLHHGTSVAATTRERSPLLNAEQQYRLAAAAAGALSAEEGEEEALTAEGYSHAAANVTDAFFLGTMRRVFSSMPLSSPQVYSRTKQQQQQQHHSEQQKQPLLLKQEERGWKEKKKKATEVDWKKSENTTDSEPAESEYKKSSGATITGAAAAKQQGLQAEGYVLCPLGAAAAAGTAALRRSHYDAAFWRALGDDVIKILQRLQQQQQLQQEHRLDKEDDSMVLPPSSKVSSSPGSAFSPSYNPELQRLANAAGDSCMHAGVGSVKAIRSSTDLETAAAAVRWQRKLRRPPAAAAAAGDAYDWQNLGRHLSQLVNCFKQMQMYHHAFFHAAEQAALLYAPLLSLHDSALLAASLAEVQQGSPAFFFSLAEYCVHAATRPTAAAAAAAQRLLLQHPIDEGGRVSNSKHGLYGSSNTALFNNSEKADAMATAIKALPPAASFTVSLLYPLYAIDRAVADVTASPTTEASAGGVRGSPQQKNGEETTSQRYSWKKRGAGAEERLQHFYVRLCFSWMHLLHAFATVQAEHQELFEAAAAPLSFLFAPLLGGGSAATCAAEGQAAINRNSHLGPLSKQQKLLVVQQLQRQQQRALLLLQQRALAVLGRKAARKSSAAGSRGVLSPAAVADAAAASASTSAASAAVMRPLAGCFQEGMEDEQQKEKFLSESGPTVCPSSCDDVSLLHKHLMKNPAPHTHFQDTLWLRPNERRNACVPLPGRIIARTLAAYAT